MRCDFISRKTKVHITLLFNIESAMKTFQCAYQNIKYKIGLSKFNFYICFIIMYHHVSDSL